MILQTGISSQFVVFFLCVFFFCGVGWGEGVGDGVGYGYGFGFSFLAFLSQ